MALFHGKSDLQHYVAVCLFCLGTVFGVCKLLDEVKLKLIFPFGVKDLFAGL